MIEQTWGVLANRFRSWHNKCEWKGKDFAARIANAIKASMVLHNRCIDAQEDLEFDDVEEKNEALQDDDEDGVPTVYQLQSHEGVRDGIKLWANRHFVISENGHLRLR